jgi:hypothetical protein
MICSDLPGVVVVRFDNWERANEVRRLAMFVVVGRFRFRSMGKDEWQGMTQGWEREFSPLARESPGFRGVQFVQLSAEEVMTVWQWESEANWDAAQEHFGPFMVEHVVPHLAGPPDRVGGEVVLQVAP